MSSEWNKFYFWNLVSLKVKCFTQTKKKKSDKVYKIINSNLKKKKTAFRAVPVAIALPAREQ